MIREMKLEDITACADILCSVYNNELWKCRWTPEVATDYLTDYFNMEKFVGYVLEEGGEVLGGIFAHEKIWWNNTEVFVEEIFVKPEKQGNGYGSMLLQQVEKYIQEKGLAGMTLLTNKYAPAPKFYEKNGFGVSEHIIYMYKEV